MRMLLVHLKNTLQRDIQHVFSREVVNSLDYYRSHIENKMVELTAIHNMLGDIGNSIKEEIKVMKIKLADVEDRFVLIGHGYD